MIVFKLNIYILYINIQTDIQMDKEKHALGFILTNYYIFFRQ